MEQLLAYAPGDTRVAAHPGRPFAVHGAKVIERFSAMASTDFWGIAFAFSSVDRQEVTDAEPSGNPCLMRAACNLADRAEAGGPFATSAARESEKGMPGRTRTCGLWVRNPTL